ncbi:GMC family oxidoreductase [Micromonospora chokoriensis]
MDGQTFDYVIVGAGSAGCVLAARLSADPSVRVALVEAGPADTDPEIRIPMSALRLLGSDHDWGYNTVGQPHLGGRHIYWPRGKTLGGSSSVNFQMWVPGHRADYDGWAGTTDQRWSWDSVQPYFRRAERWGGAPQHGSTYGTDGPLWISPPRDPDPTTTRFLAACEELGLRELADGLGGPDHTGYAVTPLNQHAGARWSAADGYLRPAEDRPNLTILTGRLVHRVCIADGRAVGIEYSGGRLLARRAVVLSAGAIGSPQILMLSGIGPAADLRELGITPYVDSAGVGANLHDHVAVDVSHHAAGPVRLLDAYAEESLRAYHERRLGPLTSNMAEAVAFFGSHDGCSAPDLELIWVPMAFTDDGDEAAGLTLSVVLLQPQSRGRVTLADADSTSPPQIDPAYLSAGQDVTTLLAGVRFADRVFGTAALRGLVSGPMAPWRGELSDEVLTATVRERAATMFHPVGTCRMGRSDDPAAVVGPDLKVHGVESLYVADGSVIPQIPRGHTHATAVMIGERAADLLRRA